MSRIDPAVGSRRRSYQTRLWNADYFVIRHLGRFLHEQVAALVKPGTRVADIGCGEQPLRAPIEARGGNYLGTDFSRGHTGGVAVLASATHLPLASNTCDLVICSEVLEHVSNHAQAFRELARVASPGGHIVVTTPFIYPLHEQPFDFVRLTVHQIESLAAHEHLEVLGIEAGGNELEVLATVWCQWFGAPGRSIPRAALRLGANVLARMLVWILGPRLPRRAYLVNAAVLRKPRSNTHSPTHRRPNVAD